jgi:hypothetical protein
MTLEVGLVIASVIPVGMMMLLWHTFVTRRAILALQNRVARQAEALALLTETSESGFAAMAQEMARLGTAPEAPRAQVLRRVSTAAARGRSESELAAAEGMSEGELHLRMHLSRQTTTDRSAHTR